MNTLMGDMSAESIRVRYARYIGAGAVAAGGILTVMRSAPTMFASLRAVVRGLRAGGLESVPDRTDRDMPGQIVIGGVIAVIAVLVLVPGVLAGDLGLGERAVAALGVAVFGVLFVAVSARIVGLIGVSSNPTSGMTLVTLLGVSGVFVLAGRAGPEARALVLTVGTVVCIAASKAGDISQDLKTGFLVGATPARQQFGQLIAAAVACWVVAATVLALAKNPGFGEGGLAAPQATLMRTVIEGVLSGSLPWDLVTTGAGLGVTAALAGLPALAFAVGLYLPLASMTPVFLGGLVRRFADARRGATSGGSDPGVLCASGLIAGEGLAGVALAMQAGITGAKPGGAVLIGGGAGEIVGALLALACLALIYFSARKGTLVAR
jgi:putative OPT family oligopeptide transporter